VVAGLGTRSQVEPPVASARVAQDWGLLGGCFRFRSARLRARFHVVLAAHAQMPEPYWAVRFLEQVVATSAHPSLLLTLAIGAWL
jgi:hypothetical protein